MTHTDAPQFFQRLAAMSELFDAKFSEAKSELYFDALRDLELRDVVRAMNEAIRIKTFMPRPAELRELAMGDAEDVAERAWLQWKDAARHIGSYQSFMTDDAALAETLIAVFGGWVEACVADFSPEMWAAKRKEFGRVYRVMCARGVSGARALPGHFEVQSQRRLAAAGAPQRQLGDGDGRD